MGMVRVLVVGVALGWVAVMVNRKFEEPPLPPLDPNPWWGPGEPKEDKVDITQFKINVPEKDLKDLKDRLALPLRLTPALEGTNFTYGFNSETLSKIVSYWTKKYDWRKREAQLNKYPQYKFGFATDGTDLSQLMKRLGFDQFYAQGGDWGSLIVTDMATLFPHNVLGVHINMAAGNTPAGNLKMVLGSVLPSGLLVAETDQHHLYPLSSFYSRLMLETGYAHIQATKPDTIGAVLDQNPVALATYILEKFSTWTHRDNPHKPDGGLLSETFPFTMDSLLDNICLYWFTGSITTSVRFYAENMNKDFYNRPINNNVCRVPSGLSMFPQDLVVIPESIAKHKFSDMVTYRLHEYGGHFAAMECPEQLAADVHEFVTLVENRH